MTEGPHDKEIAQLFNLSGNIMMRYNGLNAGISAYIAKCRTGKQDIKEIYRILDKSGKKGKPPYRFTHFIKCLKEKGELSIPEDELLDLLDKMRVIRNSIAHWMLGKADGGAFGIVDSVSGKTVDVKAKFNEFIPLYGKVNDLLIQAMAK